MSRVVSSSSRHSVERTDLPPARYNTSRQDDKPSRLATASETVQSASMSMQINSENYEEDVACYRYTHLNFCPCNGECNPSGKTMVEVFPGIFIGPLQAAFATKELIDLKITHIINAACTEYSLRPQFSYLSIPVYDMDDNISQFFRMSNNFIAMALGNGGKILIHSRRGKCRAQALALSYLIAVQKIKLKDGLTTIRDSIPETEVNESFMNQLEQYDLEKLAILRQ